MRGFDKLILIPSTVGGEVKKECVTCCYESRLCTGFCKVSSYHGLSFSLHTLP